MNDDIILSAYHGGLGDNLQFSTLPEEFYKQQGRKTYIKDGSNFRNKEIYDLVWANNPYVCGVKNGKWNAGDTPEICVENHTNNWISNWEYLHGLTPTNIRPKIYYQPKNISDYKNSILVDLSSISLSHNNQNGYNLEKVESVYQNLRKEYSDKKFVQIKFKNYIGEDVKKYFPTTDEELEVNSIFEYCDLMNSSFGICCFHSGSAVLATAIQRFNEDLKIFCLIPSSEYNSDRIQKLGIFYFDYLDYKVI
jgi:hypothetical protein